MKSSATRKDLTVVWRDVAELIPYARNARTHSDEQIAQIAASIKEFGFTNPVLVDEENGIVAGHGRVLAARKLGMEQVPTLPLRGLSKSQLRAYVIADNKLALNAGWDNELLSIELGELKDEGFELGLLGFSTDEIDDLLGDTELPEDALGVDESNEADESNSVSVYSGDEIAQDAVAFWSVNDISVLAPPLYVQKAIVNVLAGVNNPKSKIGYHVPDSYYPHRWDCKCEGASSSAHEALLDAKRIARACNVRVSDLATLANSYNTIARALGSQQAAQFNPVLAKCLYSEFVKQGEHALDPCAGWGGRLLGWWAAQTRGEYFAVDASKATVDSASKMIQALNISGATVEHSAFEDVADERIKNRFSLAMTSPPYFSKELYSNDAEQSFRRYATYTDWKRGFLSELLRKCALAITSDGVVIINIADVNIKSERCTLEKDTVAIAESFGLKLSETRNYAMSANRGSIRDDDAGEPVFIFKKG